MKTLHVTILAAGLALAGCRTCDYGINPADPAVGNWGLKLGYPVMNAGHMVVSRGADGKAQALVLWRWASPSQMKNVVLDGGKIAFDHPSGFKFEGTVDGKSTEKGEGGATIAPGRFHVGLWILRYAGG